MPRILFTTFGSYGDLYPYLAIGRELQKRGHAITIATSAAYQTKVEAEGLAFHAVRPDIDLGDRALLDYVMNARHGSERVVRFMAGQIRESYEDTLAAARHADILVSHPITFAAVLAAQKLRKKWISTVLAPLSMLSAYDPPVSAQMPWLARVQRKNLRISQALWRLAKRVTLPWVKDVVDFRRQLGLGVHDDAGGHPLFEGQHSPWLVLALYSQVLAEPQKDWPAQTVVTGFPFYEHGSYEIGEPAFAWPFEGPPVVFTLGSSAVGAAGSFYRESLRAVQRIGSPAIFLTGPHAQGLPEMLPANVLAIPYAPHAAVFPEASVIVHQGGIGTTAQAMRAGRPMLVVPFGHDQFDNAARVKRLGVAEVLNRSEYKEQKVAEMLRRLLHPDYARNAAILGERIRAENGVRAAADALEAIL